MIKEQDRGPLKGHAGWAAIIAAVHTPLGFFALVVLVVEAIFGAVVLWLAGDVQRYMVFAMIALIFFLVLTVITLAIWKPGALLGTSESRKEVTPTRNRLSTSIGQKLASEQAPVANGLPAKCALIGLRGISLEGSRDTRSLGPRIRVAEQVKIMFTSGATFLALHHEDLLACLQRGGRIRVLLAKPQSEFVEDVERAEGRSMRGEISDEIMHSIERLNRLVREAASTKKGGKLLPTSAVEYGHYRTHLRLSLVIVDDRYCYAILCYSPKRTTEALGLMFEVESISDDSPAHHITKHFDTVFEQLEGDGAIKRIPVLRC